MPQDEPSGPDLDGVVADANAVGLQYVGRPQDHRDLEELESFHGELPIESIPGLDT
jgi:hypothetical protein